MAGRGRGGGVALPGMGAGGAGRGTGIALSPPAAAGRAGVSPRGTLGRGTGIAAPKRAVPTPAGAPAPAPAKRAPPPAPGAGGGGAAGGAMPRKFKVPPAPPERQGDAGVDARLQGTKVRRSHIPQYDKRKWSSAMSLFYPYDKIKKDFELQGLFTRMKEKAWVCIYYDLVLFYLPTKEGPPSMEDKLEGKPFAYFFLDNVVDSDKIKLNEAKLSIHLPTQNSKDDLKLICDTQQQFKEWGTTIRELCKMFETTPREGIESREEVEKNLELVQRDLPLAFDVPCENIDHTKAGDWLLEMRKLSDMHRKHAPFIERIERFSAYRVGHTAVYCNFFQGRDRDGPTEVLVKAKKKVLGFWESEVDRIIALCEEVLGEDAIDVDHLPFHMEDCQIAAFYIDCTNSYSAIVNGVPAHKLVMQKKLAKLEELYGRLKSAPTMQ